MIGYATVTGTRKNRAVIERHGWRWLLGPFTHNTPGPTRYALDNGAWSAYMRNVEFDVPAFERVVTRWGSGSDFIVLPDIISGGHASLKLSLDWVNALSGVAPLLLAVQDGMAPDHIEPFMDLDIDGLFVGGSTEWKLNTMLVWGEFAKRWSKYLHIGRVNTRRRIRLASLAGSDSFDGTSVTRFSKTIYPLDAETRQSTFDFQ
tara:strand:+ start:1505 stop:2116 length:612 start_codon:yes stop_codon:yes gene_type:complete